MPQELVVERRGEAHPGEAHPGEVHPGEVHLGVGAGVIHRVRLVLLMTDWVSETALSRASMQTMVWSTQVTDTATTLAPVELFSVLTSTVLSSTGTVETAAHPRVSTAPTFVMQTLSLASIPTHSDRSRPKIQYIGFIYIFK